MKKQFTHSYDGYYDDVSFLELTKEYEDMDDHDLRRTIAQEVYHWIIEADDACYMSLGEAHARINVFKYIINKRNK